MSDKVEDILKRVGQGQGDNKDPIFKESQGSSKEEPKQSLTTQPSQEQPKGGKDQISLSKPEAKTVTNQQESKQQESKQQESKQQESKQQEPKGLPQDVATAQAEIIRETNPHLVTNNQWNASRPSVGNPIYSGLNVAGDKVFDLLDDGTYQVKVLSSDHTRELSIQEYPNTPNNQNDVTKRRARIFFPPIKIGLSQRQITINLPNENDFYFALPPDVPTIDVLLPANAVIRVNVEEVDKDGELIDTSFIDIHTDQRVTPRPLIASPIRVNLMELVLTRQPK